MTIIIIIIIIIVVIINSQFDHRVLSTSSYSESPSMINNSPK